MRQSEKRRNNILIGVLLGVVALMGIAYAAFASNLNITGTSSMSENWCIGFDSTRTSDYTAQAGIQGGTTPTGSMSFSGDSCGGNLKTTASLNVSFKQPGDKVVYTLTIGNQSSLEAAIESITVDDEDVTSNTTKTKGNIKFKIEMPEDTTLAAGAVTTMKVIVEFQNDTNINSLTSSETQSISVKINAVQSNGSNGMEVTPEKFTGTIYRWNTNILYNGLTMNGPAEFYYNPSYFSSAQEAFEAGARNVYKEKQSCGDTCQSGTVTLSAGEYTTDASTLGKTYYLKHDVVDDIITNSYVCFVYNNAEHCMKGADDGASFETNTQTIRDYQTFYNLPDNDIPGCSFDPDYGGSICYNGDFFQVESWTDGSVDVYGLSSEYCTVNNDGSSWCNQ